MVGKGGLQKLILVETAFSPLTSSLLHVRSSNSKPQVESCHTKNRKLLFTNEFSSVQSLSRVRLFATPWITAHHASLSITNSWSLPKLMSIESVIPSSHLILCLPLLLLPPIPPSIRVFSNESTLRMRWPKYWSFSFSISLSNEHPGLNLLYDGQVGSPCSPRDSQESSPTPQFKSINSLVLNFLYSPTLTSIDDYWKTITMTRWTFVGKVMSLLFNMLSSLVIAFLPRSKHLLTSLILGKGPESLHFQLALTCGWHCCSQTTFWAARLLDAVLKAHLKLMWQHFNSRIRCQQPL